MSASKTIYTIGHLPLMSFASFIKHLQRYGINCVVDIRLIGSLSLNEFSETSLRNSLKQYGVHYLPFFEEFAFVDLKARDSYGEPVYRKLIKTERFLKGMERLELGASRGYTIVLLGFSTTPSDCFRYKCISPYLNDNGWTVYHITESGQAVSDKEIRDRLAIDSQVQYMKRKRAASLGRLGEELAADYLIRQGFTILDRNWNLHRGCELDIVAYKDSVLHAVEVKTRSNDMFTTPEQAIDRRKFKNIMKAFHQYRYEKYLFNIPAQIDSIAVVVKGENDYTIKMYEDLHIMTTWRY